MGKFLRTISELERLLYHKDFVDERILNNEIAEWRKFRMEIKERFLWGKINGYNKYMESWK